MSSLSQAVSLHPYFKPAEGKLEVFLELLPQFVERTSGEEGCLYYDFSVSDGQVYCREAYVDAEAALAHVANVGELLEQALGMSELVRFEVHGPAGELAKLEEPWAGLNPQWWELKTGVAK
ncbi:MAG: antibiotic biosynthesis monooxygenase [Verrucomicrobiales bacterium]|nr:antibiotic biosynthesis monooxygenase [Verrucomicrobiales bacterium]